MEFWNVLSFVMELFPYLSRLSDFSVVVFLFCFLLLLFFFNSERGGHNTVNFLSSNAACTMLRIRLLLYGRRPRLDGPFLPSGDLFMISLNSLATDLTFWHFTTKIAIFSCYIKASLNYSVPKLHKCRPPRVTIWRPDHDLTSLWNGVCFKTAEKIVLDRLTLTRCRKVFARGAPCKKSYSAE